MKNDFFRYGKIGSIKTKAWLKYLKFETEAWLCGMIHQ